MGKRMNRSLCLVAVVVLALQSCKENIDMSDRYTFTDETAASYLEKHEDYSEYYHMLGQVQISKRSESTVLQLLSARGNYTVFAPSNDAMHLYLDSMCRKGLIDEPSWEAFHDEEILDSVYKVIVYNSIIDCGDDTEAYNTSTFPGDSEEFMIANMNDRKLVMNYGNDPDSMYINGIKDDDGNVQGGSLIDQRNRDIQVINGCIHQVQTVVAPSDETLSDLLKSFVDTGTEGFIVMAKAVQACGLSDTLSRIRDEVYEELYQTDRITTQFSYSVKSGYTPEHRKYGFTIFAETDDFWRDAIGKQPIDITVEDLKAWVVSQGIYPDATDDEDYTNTDNVLNRFVTYHILPMRLPVDKLVIHYNEKGYYYATSTRYTVAVWELYTTMGKRRLIKLYQVGNVDGIFINRFPNLDNSRTGTYRELSCDDDKGGFLVVTSEAQNVVNGYLYPIKPVNESAGPQVLAYTTETRENFQKQRLRFKGSALFPEFMNNDIRANRVNTTRNQNVYLPPCSEYQYCENLYIEDGSYFYNLGGLAQGWFNYQGDEINCIGRYDLTYTLPPVPMKGTYEIRYLVSSRSDLRGMCQVYFGSDTNNLYAMGIPLDLRLRGDSEFVGWTEDTGDEDVDAEEDKKLRNKGFMKAPEHYHAGTASDVTARNSVWLTRRIIVQQDMDPDKTYYLRFKTVLDAYDKECKLDHFEYCAKEIYDNPSEPEDVW